MIKKEVLIGFIVGVLANILGIILYILLFSKQAIGDTVREAFDNDFFGTLIAAGAILNFIPFFLFLKKDRVYRARGVLLASVVAALTIAVLKIY